MSVLAIGESLGWPFLAAPLQQVLTKWLERRVQFSGEGPFRVRFVGGVRLQAAQLEIAAPAWSTAPHLLLASELELDLRYTDLWRAQRGQRLRIQRLQASTVDAQLERLADGRASWSLRPVTAASAPAPMPVIATLQAASGRLRFTDAASATDVSARLTQVGGLRVANAPGEQVIRIDASGKLNRLPLTLEMVVAGLVPDDGSALSDVPITLTVKGRLGRGQFDFAGTALDWQQAGSLSGRFALQGPSLAAFGDVVGVTLPTTAAFRSQGLLVKQGARWRVLVEDATIGSSRLNAALQYEAGPGLPLLSGRLAGQRLLLADLGPVVGTSPVPAVGAAAKAAPNPGKGRVLPDRPFDLAALRAMDANVLIDIDKVDLNTSLLEPLHPLRGHLQLRGGVLTVSALEARAAQGRLTGDLALDGRGDVALWQADLRWDALQLERWIRQARASAAPPFVSGRLSGRAQVQGQGRSTAEILSSLKGNVRTEVRGGAVSHLVIEAAGLDLAQSLGVLIKGDDALPLTCAVADLVAERGVLRTRVMVLDTSDSTVWFDGTLSLASEQIDVRALVSPKDFSPLALRAPLRVRGSLADPVVSVEKGSVARKLAGSLLLGLINPLAALVPLLDPGDAAEAGRHAAGCQGLMKSRTVPRTVR